MKDKTIFITGGNAGLGLATAKLFAQNGANVAIVARRVEQNEIAVKAVKEFGVGCISFAGDVTDEAFIRNAVATTKNEFGGLHYVFNNAGVEQLSTPLPEQTVEDYRRIMDVNVMGVWLVMRETAPVIKESGGGCIVNTSSILGHIGFAMVPLYNASKHAVIGLTKSVALEYAQQGVRVNSVSPAVVRTDLFDRFAGGDAELVQAMEAMHPMGRSGAPEEVASAVLYLCRDATWTTGQSLVMDGGFTVQ
ncbi:MAG: glucose 1-dehydrogenase [Verrucomicrobiota bacterium]